MRTSQRHGLALIGFIVVVSLGLGAGTIEAYEQWSENGDFTLCGACHGDFRSNLYISNTDGTVWGNLHNIHRNTMLDGDCDACHGAGDEFPVLIGSSVGGDGLAPISCMGCHGRNEDNTAANPEFPNGLGAGLRQHHFNAGEPVCLDCHDDSDPANYTVVGENVLPEYYANPGTGHPAMPTDPCNGDGSENFAGVAEGLDNDGDNVYDGDDTDCASTVGVGESLAQSSDGALRLSVSPNPMSGPGAEIVFSLSARSDVTVEIHETSGRLVKRDVLNGLASGVHSIGFDGRDRNGRPLPSGVYFVHVRTSEASETGRVVLIR